jgi:hypothetical protein
MGVIKAKSCMMSNVNIGMLREGENLVFGGDGRGNMGFGPSWLLVWIIVLPNESNFSNSQMPRIKKPK